MCAYCFHFQYCLLLPGMNGQVHIRCLFFSPIALWFCHIPLVQPFSRSLTLYRIGSSFSFVILDFFLPFLLILVLSRSIAHSLSPSLSVGFIFGALFLVYLWILCSCLFYAFQEDNFDTHTQLEMIILNIHLHRLKQSDIFQLIAPCCCSTYVVCSMCCHFSILDFFAKQYHFCYYVFFFRFSFVWSLICSFFALISYHLCIDLCMTIHLFRSVCVVSHVWHSHSVRYPVYFLRVECNLFFFLVYFPRCRRYNNKLIFCLSLFLLSDLCRNSIST